MNATHFNITAVERDTGLSKDVLRMWERRYGLNVGTRRTLAVIARCAPISAKELATRTSSDAFHGSREVAPLI